MRSRFTAIGVLGLGMSLVSPKLTLIDPALADEAACSLASVRGTYAVYG